MRCQNCNKFTALNFEDPEMEQDVELSDGTVRASVRIVRTTECCGEEAKEATLEMEEDIPQDIIDAHTGEGHELEVEAGEPEQIEEGGGRYAKSYFGASVDYSIRCSCQKEKDDPLHEGTLSDKIAASHMEELL